MLPDDSTHFERSKLLRQDRSKDHPRHHQHHHYDLVKQRAPYPSRWFYASVYSRSMTLQLGKRIATATGHCCTYICRKQHLVIFADEDRERQRRMACLRTCIVCCKRTARYERLDFLLAPNIDTNIPLNLGNIKSASQAKRAPSIQEI